jgi:hypothetical protein
MLIERLSEGTSLDAGDLRSYVALDRLARRLGAGDVLEYWKSTPYALNFMEGYKLTTSLEQALEDGLSQREIGLLAGAAHRIRWADFEEYRELESRQRADCGRSLPTRSRRERGAFCGCLRHFPTTSLIDRSTRPSFRTSQSV